MIFKVYNYANLKELFIKTLYDSILLFNPTRVIMPIDDYVGNSFRRKILPTYKQRNDKQLLNHSLDYNFKKEKFSILKIIKTILPVYFLKYKGYEADDIISIICKIISDNIDIIIWSNDLDLVQLQQKFNNVKVYDPKSKSFFKSPKYNLAYYKSIIGDKSDNIPGIIEMNHKMAKKALSSYSEFIRLIASDPIKYIKYKNNLKIIDLINNNLEIPSNLIFILESSVKYHQKAFERILKNNKIYSIIKQINEYHQAFYYLEKYSEIKGDNFFNKGAGK